MPHNENSRVKIPALVHFTRLGYKYISLRKYEGVIDDDTNILVDVLCDAINRINATSLTTTDVQKIVNALKAMLENDDLGREFYSVLINGYNGLKLIDFEDFGGTVNSYHVVTEMTCKNGSDEFRPDITPLINGIPLAFIEVKKPNNKGGIKAEYDRMLMRIKNKKFRRFINLTQIMVFSNNSEYDDTEAVPLEGAFYSTISYEKLFFSHFREEDEKLLTSVPEKDEAVENFILTDNNLSSIKYSPEYVTNSSPVSPTNRIITSLFSFERILAGDNYKKRFWAGVPNIPNKDKDKMAIYLMFLQHIIYSLGPKGKAAVVVPTGFLTAGSGIQKKIREHLVKERMLRGVISMPSNIFASTGTNVSILFLDRENKDGNVILMDASKLGTKEKVDGKNQRTVLSVDEITHIIKTFNAGKAEDDFCVTVSYADIEGKKLSFSAGQYFEVKIDYVELTPEEFAEKMTGFTARLDELFAESRRLEDEIKVQLGRVKYE